MRDWNKLEDLKGYNIGISRGNTYTDEFRNLGEKQILTLKLSNNELINFKKLLKKRIDVFPSSLVMAYELLRKNFSSETIEKLTYNKKPLTIATGHLLFPKVRNDSKKYLKIFNSGLKKIKDDGTYDKYMEDLLNGKYSK